MYVALLFWLWAGCALGAPFVAALGAASYSAVVVFGDSLVDNVRRATDAGQRHLPLVEQDVARGSCVL